MQKTLFKSPKGVIAVAGAATIVVTTLFVTFMPFMTAQAQSSGGIWSGSEFCEKPGPHNYLPEVVVEQ